jgi:hypothetical protein
MGALFKYEQSLKDYPARGSGLHQHIMSCACLGVIAEVPPLVIINDMEENFQGIKPNEAADAVAKASTTDFERPEVSRRPVIEKVDIRKFTEGYGTDLMELVEASPYRLLNDIDADAYTLLEHLYTPDEFLFIGDVFDREVKTVREWLGTNLQFPHIIPNPMTGKIGQTDMGKPSYRCEGTIADMRYAVCEMDEVPLEQQVAFWLKCIKIIPVVAIIHSGGKSLHAWVKVDCGLDHDKWERDVKGWLFDTFGVKYGFDRACSNKSRLSRLPGFKREGKAQQRLLYLGDK